MEDETDPNPADLERGGTNRRNLIGLGVVVVVAVAVLVAVLGSAKSKLEDCLISGRRDCAPIATAH